MYSLSNPSLVISKAPIEPLVALTFPVKEPLEAFIVPENVPEPFIVIPSFVFPLFISSVPTKLFIFI